jgi:hypothetical protein
VIGSVAKHACELNAPFTDLLCCPICDHDIEPGQEIVLRPARVEPYTGWWGSSVTRPRAWVHEHCADSDESEVY